MPEILLALYVLLFFAVKQPYLSYDRVINSDGKVYYGYLTAIFIYHDFTYSFIPEYEKEYYTTDQAHWKEFRTPVDGRVVNKGFPGLAVLFLPFFLIGHLLTLLLGFPPDGYSIIYQYAMGFCALFYFWAGFRMLRLLLRQFRFGESLIAGILVLIALGTNIIYYTLKEGTMGHVYSFALIGAFLLMTMKAVHNFRRRYIVTAALLLGLIAIIRPTNALIILLVPFLAGSGSGFMKLIKNTLSKKNVIPVVLAAMIFPFMAMLLWYLQSGHWIVYSYGGEGFDFASPHFFQILFSFEKGWFLYTPVALLAMTGFVALFRRNRYRFGWMLAFLVIFVYVASSWWAWAYTSNFGQRIFIDLYAPVGIMMGFAWQLVRSRRWQKSAVQVLLLLLVGLNGLQFYQHYTYVFPPGKITAQKYADAFFRLVPAARAGIPDSLVVAKSVFSNDFESDYGWLNYGSVSDTLAYAGCCASMTNRVNPYTIGLLKDINPLVRSPWVWVRVEAQIYSNAKRSTANLVIQLENSDGIFFYQPFYLAPYNRQNKWTRVEFATLLPPLQSPADKLRVFFYDMNKKEFFLVDNLRVEVLSISRAYSLF